MVNPGGPYAGREPGLGRLKTGEMAFFYFGSGRSPPSQGRYASPFLPRECAVRIKPIDKREGFDQFRHYQAVRVDPRKGTVLFSNSQSPNDPIFEALLFRPHEMGKLDRARRILATIGPEYDNMSKRTSRVLGAILPKETPPVGFLGITVRDDEAITREYAMHEIDPGKFFYVPTYDGNVDYRNFDPIKLKLDQPTFRSEARSAQELAEEIYEMSDYVDPKYGELRVWCVAGVHTGKGPGGWAIRRHNRHKVK